MDLSDPTKKLGPKRPGHLPKVFDDPQLEAKRRENAERSRLRAARLYASDPAYREKQKQLYRERYARDAAYKKTRSEQKRRHRTGWAPEEFERALREQEGKCAICARVPEKGLKADHCHRTLRPRGLLCSPCNAWIGTLERDLAQAPQTLQNLLAYFQKHVVPLEGT